MKNYNSGNLTCVLIVSGKTKVNNINKSLKIIFMFTKIYTLYIEKFLEIAIMVAGIS